MEHDATAGPGRRPAGTDTEVRGRTATAGQLRALLPDAPAGFLTDALDNPALVPDHVVLLLQNRAASPAALVKIARRTEWTRLYDVKRGLVGHPSTPPTVARLFVHHLYWRDLADVAADLRVHPTVRRRAEDLLEVRLGQLTLGERIALARRAVRGLVGPLAELGEPAVLSALLGNPRLVEGNVVAMARSAETPGEILDALVDDLRWGARLAVRKALLRNPRTPIHAALRILDRLSRQDLRAVQSETRIPRIVRLGAQRRLGLTP